MARFQKSKVIEISRPRQVTRLATIDALRGFAALIVLLPHSVGFFALLRSGSWCRELMSNMGVIGTHGVDVFFVLSGFVIATTSANRRLTFPSAPHFMFRRLARIAPPYWVSIAVMLGVLQLQSISGRNGDHLPSVPDIVAHFFYVQEIIGFGSINVVYWTLCLEIQFYLFFALASASVHAFAEHSQFDRRSIALGGLVITAFLSVALVFTPSITVFRGLCFSHWHEFALGILAFSFISMPTPYIKWFSLASIFGIGTVALLAQSWHSLTAMATALLILDCGRKGLLETRWNQSVPQYLGRISYSLYLVHVPVIFIWLAARARFRPDSALVSWGFFIGMLLSSIIVAHILALPVLEWVEIEPSEEEEDANAVVLKGAEAACGRLDGLDG